MPTFPRRHSEPFLSIHRYEPYDRTCPERPTRRRHSSSHRPSRPVTRLPAAWLAAQLAHWPPTAIDGLRSALERAGYPADSLEEDTVRSLLELGQLPFYRFDLYRHWLLRAGGPDLLAEVRQYSPHLDEPPATEVV